jgi:methyl-accepting chemotaxis protein
VQPLLVPLYEQQQTASQISQTIGHVAESAQRVQDLAASVNKSSGATGNAVTTVSDLTTDLGSTGKKLQDRADNFLAYFRRAA